MSKPQSLYEADFYAWTQDQAAKLRAMLDARVNSELDLEHLAEELDDMGRSHRSQLVNRLAELDVHLMKLAFSLLWEPRRQWRLSVRGQRLGIAKLVKQNPSLKRHLSEALTDAHEIAVRQFDEEKLIELGMNELPVLCPFDLDDMLRDDWWPEPRGADDVRH